MKKKNDGDQNKRKREMKLLFGLGIVAFILFIMSILLLFNSNEDAPVQPTPPIDTVDQVVEETPTEPSDDDNQEEGENTIPNKDETPDDQVVEEDGPQPVKTAETYGSANLDITFEIPPSWEGLVEVYEDEDRLTIDFLYKGTYSFLTLRAIADAKYEDDKGYFDSFYKQILKYKNMLVLYSLPNEHPLAGREGSNDYNELNAIMSDNYNLIKTVKAK